VETAADYVHVGGQELAQAREYQSKARRVGPVYTACPLPIVSSYRTLSKSFINNPHFNWKSDDRGLG
jgi:hypothetical protein